MSAFKSITVDLAHAKLLQKADWPHEEAFFWWQFYDVIWALERCSYHTDCFAAPTAEEILRRLPIEIDHYALQIFRGSRVSRGWVIYYESMMFGNDEWIYEQYDTQSLANAAAAMWCYLAEQNLLPKA